MRRPSQRSIDLFNQLVEKQNQVRNYLRKIHKRAEEAYGAGRLPALVTPKSARKVRLNQFQGLSREELKRRTKMFWDRYRLMKSLFGAKDALRSYLGKTVVRGYRELWIDLIGVDPERYGKYSQEQIESSSQGEFMEVFNQLFKRGGEEFFYRMLLKGEIIEFRWIYMEFQNGYKENGYLDQQVQNIMKYKGLHGKQALYSATANIMPLREMQRDDKGRHIGGRFHKESTLREAKKRQELDEEEE